MTSHFRPGTAVRLNISFLEMDDTDSTFTWRAGRELLIDVPSSWDTEMLASHLHRHLSSILSDCEKELNPHGTPAT